VAAPALIIAKTAQATFFFRPHRNGMDTVIGIEGCVERLESLHPLVFFLRSTLRIRRFSASGRK
jgi:hypothetical protein